mmetsp:Transcript_22442/g.29092  ORF Transcript_22442/g.29092 Transcript_22442/m.29092 type:complete len:124 (+) Transcript_22442:36-407(+)|eukprot:CAMPEP_0197325682 /NCGR_PEP_ID=MMETSP0892-20130614/808_1 /TAXON_ID=44058 ORGANISM="Aureoumbra lagunensis, Strain CCMP1510" /NCGR_SAMPLE_ID=MMETSP0892 /ASSEMBLY_ACC=CAM_ASM_000538 /LENGTH=123 /DNA_ID=CAMNT_0042819165 /DNA_START=24 /DNA_END=395 /DNA_ORIENTATION=-
MLTRRFARISNRVSPLGKGFGKRWGTDGRKEATLFNETTETKWEGWEPIVYTTYAASMILLVFGLTNRPNTSIQDWAREEALVRLKRYDAGQEVKFGVHYSQIDNSPNFSKEEVGAVPELAEE